MNKYFVLKDFNYQENIYIYGNIIQGKFPAEILDNLILIDDNKKSVETQKIQLIKKTVKAVEKLDDKKTIKEKYNIKGKIADIIIPHHNRHDLLKNTLDKLPLDIFNIIIVAGGSFARNCNMGAKMAQTDNLIFMNDDTEPDVDQLIKSCRSKADIVGFTEILPNENNAIIYGIGWNFKDDGSISSNLKRDPRDVHIPSGFLFRVKKKAWQKLKGFNERFINSREDMDLGLRAKKMGMIFDYIRTGNPIVHYHMQSKGRMDNVDKNRKYLHKIWTDEKIKKVLKLENRTKQILLTNNSMEHLSGSETFTYTMAKELERRGFKVDVFTFHQGKASEEFFTIYPKNQKEKLRMDYDYIFINHNTCLKHLKTVRGFKVFTSHGIYPDLEQPQKGADLYVSISQEVKNHLKDLDFKSVLIHNGIDCQRFKPRKKIHKKLKSVLSICKGVEANEIIENACKILGVKFKAVRDVVDGKIIEVKEVENYINEADLVVSLGRGCYEAMIGGKAVIVFDKRGYMDKKRGDGIVTKDNVNELLLNNFSGRRYNIDFDVKGLVKELKKYKQEMGKFNREYALKHFDIKKQVDKYFKAIDNKKKKRIMFVGSSTTDYGIAKQLEKQLEKLDYEIGVGGKKICYANDIGTIDPKDGSLIIPENRITFKRAIDSGADHIFYSQKSCAEYFPKKKSSYLPSGIDEDIFKDLQLKRNIDIGFVGKEMFSSRQKFIKFLKDNYGDKIEKQEGIFFGDVAEFYNRCKIVANQSTNNDINMRMFEATASGSLLITQKVSYLDELFNIDKEIVVYSTMRELKQKIDYYLKHKDEREMIAKAGQKKTLKNHIYLLRAKKIIRIIK